MDDMECNESNDKIKNNTELNNSQLITDELDFENFIEVLSQKNAQRKNRNQEISSTSFILNRNVNNNDKSSALSSQAAQQQRDNQQANADKNEKDKALKMPAINVYDIDISYLKKIIKTKLNIHNFLIREYNENHSIIRTFNKNDYNAICNILKSTNANFFTYTPKDEKRVTLVLKGLNSTYECEEVLRCLKDLEYEKLEFEKVTRLLTKKSIQNNKILPFYIVQLSPKSNINDVFKIKAIDNQIVYWENLMKTPILQCTRCQRYFHSASNCNMDRRCVKCGKTHLPGECEITIEDPKENLFCIICKQNGHPRFTKEFCSREKSKRETLNITLYKGTECFLISYNQTYHMRIQ